jgi:F0F1-type ATP synthase assembly protein I
MPPKAQPAKPMQGDTFGSARVSGHEIIKNAQMNKNLILLIGTVISIIVIMLWHFEKVEEPISALFTQLITFLRYYFAMKSEAHQGERESKIIEYKIINTHGDNIFGAQVHKHYHDRFNIDEVINSLDFGDRLSNEGDNFVFRVSKEEIQKLRDDYYKRTVDEKSKSILYGVLFLTSFALLFVHYLSFIPLIVFSACLAKRWEIFAYDIEPLKVAIDTAEASYCLINPRAGNIEFNNGLKTNLVDLGKNFLYESYLTHQKNFACIYINSKRQCTTIVTNVNSKREMEQLTLLILSIKEKYQNKEESRH